MSAPFRRAGRPAAVLIFILYATLFLSVLLVYVMRSASLEVRLRAPIIYAAEMRHQAYNAMYAALTELREYKEMDEGLYAYEQGWGSLCSDGRAMLPKDLKVNVTVTDESAKLPLRSMSPEQLEALLYEMGLPQGNLQEISNTILDWMDGDDDVMPSGAEKDEYDSEGALPPNRPMRSFTELKFVKEAGFYFFDENGFPNDYYRMFASSVSLYTEDEVNLNNASELVLRALFKMDEITFDENTPRAIKGQSGAVRDGITWVTSTADISSRGGTVPPRFAGVSPKLLKIDIEVSRGLASYRLTVFCDVSDDLKVTQIVEGGKD